MTNVNNHELVRNNSYLLYLSIVLDFRKRTLVVIMVITSSSVDDVLPPFIAVDHGTERRESV